MAFGVCESFRVRLSPGDRYAATVLIRARDAVEADARLRALGVVAHQIHHTDRPPNQMLDAFDEARPGLDAEPAGAGLPGDADGLVDERPAPVDAELPEAALASPADDAPYPGCPADDGGAEPPAWAVEQVPAQVYVQLQEEPAMDESPTVSPDSPSVPAPWLAMQASLTAHSSAVARLT